MIINRRRLIAILLLLTVAISISGVSYANTPKTDHYNPASQSLSLARSPEVYSKDLERHALQYFNETQIIIASSPEMYGYTAEEATNLEVGQPFSIYLIDDELQYSVPSSLIFPLLYQESIVGVLEAASATDGEYSFTIGRSYGDSLNNL